MKLHVTENLMETVVSFAKAGDLYFRNSWDIDESWDTRDNDVKIIDGAVAMKKAEELHLKICGCENGNQLHEGVGYIFRFTKDSNKLYPFHMTMLPKTSANLKRGSNRYGSGAIRAELG